MDYSSEAFTAAYTYEGDDLGCTYTPEKTTLKVWAPTATRVACHLAGEGEEAVMPMEKGAQGVWTLSLEGDREGWTYVYRVYLDDVINEATDPYAIASTVNHERTVIIDPAKTLVPDDRSALKPLEHYTDAIIYELHVRDFSVDTTSGMGHKGQFLALTEEGVKTPQGKVGGTDYLQSLGVTHIQLLPVYDFGSVDEEHPFESYNWGYDPVQYNVPEGSYASDIENPYARIVELKQAIAHLHSKGLRVIMDVVYNHMYDRATAAFEKIVPGYYFRLDASGESSNGSFCGNDVDSTKPMVQKFLLASTRMWIEQYGFDGFRFDLMGILDIDTMNAIAKQTLSIRGDAMIYGEGWNMPTFLDDEHKATMMNHHRMPNIAHFSDIFRDSIKGATMEDKAHEKGYGSGDTAMALEAVYAMMGTTMTVEVAGQKITSYFDAPGQTVNYVACHDNHTLWDKLLLACPGEETAILKRRHRFITSLVLLSQGIPFLHAGQEFYRTKSGDHNSYRSSDEVNKIRWDEKDANEACVQYVRDLIALRKSYPEFRLRTAKEIAEASEIDIDAHHCIRYDLWAEEGKDYKGLSLLINPNTEAVTMAVGESCEIIFNHEGMCQPQSVSGDVVVEPLSVYCLRA